MYVGEENQFLPEVPDWIQVRPLNQEVAMIHLVRKHW
jgi:negative regulator of genetic competence, sporulation and motility